jgi:hypothetical protein
LGALLLGLGFFAGLAGLAKLDDKASRVPFVSPRLSKNFGGRHGSSDLEQLLQRPCIFGP